MPPSNSSPEKDRSYLVLEELDVVALLRTLIDNEELLDSVEDALPGGDHTIYRRLGTTTTAVNAKQARRKASNRAYEGVEDSLLPDRVVSVPIRMWQPGPVNRSSTLRVG